METQVNTNSNKKIKLDFKESKYATGRRKKSIARVWLKAGTGVIHVNGKKMIDYFKKPNLQLSVCRPLTTTKKENAFDIRCTVKGGGLSGQDCCAWSVDSSVVTFNITRSLGPIQVLQDLPCKARQSVGRHGVCPST